MHRLHPAKEGGRDMEARVKKQGVVDPKQLAYIASSEGDFRYLDKLIKSGTDVNYYVAHQNPLDEALQSKFPKCAKLLIRAGAQPTEHMCPDTMLYYHKMKLQNCFTAVAVVKDMPEAIQGIISNYTVSLIAE